MWKFVRLLPLRGGDSGGSGCGQGKKRIFAIGGFMKRLDIS
jgi:hypothetical protein